MKKLVVFSLIGSLLFTVEWAMGMADKPQPYSPQPTATEQPREPKRYGVEYYVPVIRVQPEIEYIANTGAHARFKTVLEGYKISNKPRVEVKMDPVKNIYYIPIIRTRWSLGGLIGRARVRGWIRQEIHVPYSGGVSDYRFRARRIFSYDY